MKSVVHNPQECIVKLAKIKARSTPEQLAITNAIACLNHMQNVCQRQKKQLTELQNKVKPCVTVQQ